MPAVIVGIPDILPDAAADQRALAALPIWGDVDARVVEVFCFFRVVGLEVFCHEAAAGLGDCLFVSLLDGVLGGDWDWGQVRYLVVGEGVGH